MNDDTARAIREHLRSGDPVLAMIRVTGLHWIFLTGIDGDNVIVCDSLKDGLLREPFNEFVLGRVKNAILSRPSPLNGFKSVLSFPIIITHISSVCDCITAPITPLRQHTLNHIMTRKPRQHTAHRSTKRGSTSTFKQFVRVILAIIVAVSVVLRWLRCHSVSAPAPAPTASGNIARLFREQRSDTWVETRGVVERVLPDDRDTADGSSMHQRLIVRTDDGVNILVAHNICTSDRVPAKPGDRLTLRGEYEWTEKGGTLHFTHRPKFATQDATRSGWIDHAGRRYE